MRYSSIFHSLSFFLLCLCGCQSKEKEVKLDIQTISINPNEVQPKLDLSSIVQDNGIDIIPLETKDECFVTDIKKLEVHDNIIYISDQKQDKILVFNTQGKFLRGIGRRGGGVGEFVQLGDFTVAGDSVYIQDNARNRYIVYNKEGKFLYECEYPVLHFTLLNLDNKFFFVTNYFKSPSTDYYNLFQFDMNTHKIVNSYLPYNPKDINQKHNIILNSHACKLKDHALINLTFNDTIYKIDKQGVYPYLLVTFTERQMPEDLKLEEKFPISQIAKKGYLKGLDLVKEVDHYLFGEYGDKGKPRFILYDKQSKKVQIGERFMLAHLGDLPFIASIYTTEDGDLFMKQYAFELQLNWKNMKYANKQFKDKALQQRLESVVENLNEESNPVLFRLKLK